MHKFKTLFLEWPPYKNTLQIYQSCRSAFLRLQPKVVGPCLKCQWMHQPKNVTAKNKLFPQSERSRKLSEENLSEEKN